MDKYQEVALELFSTNLYNDVSLNEIIKLANTGKSAFYSLYKDKKKLYFSLIDEISRLKMEFIVENNNGKVPDIFTILEQSRDIIEYFNLKDQRIYKFYIIMKKNIEAGLFEELKEEGKKQLYTFIKNELIKYRDKSILRDDVNIDSMVKYLAIVLEDSNMPWNDLVNFTKEECNGFIKILRKTILKEDN